MTTIVLPMIGALCVVVRTTWLADFSIVGAQPEIAMLVIAYYGHQSGVQKGQIAGFVVGLVHDALSVAPIGFYAVLGLVSGAIAGTTRDAFLTDSFMAPPALTLVVMLARSAIAIAMSVILRLPEVRYQVFSVANLAELGLTVVAAPIVFALLRPLQERLDRRGVRY